MTSCFLYKSCDPDGATSGQQLNTEGKSHLWNIQQVPFHFRHSGAYFERQLCNEESGQETVHFFHAPGTALALGHLNQLRRRQLAETISFSKITRAHSCWQHWSLKFSIYPGPTWVTFTRFLVGFDLLKALSHTDGDWSIASNADF